MKLIIGIIIGILLCAFCLLIEIALHKNHNTITKVLEKTLQEKGFVIDPQDKLTDKQIEEIKDNLNEV